MTTIDRRSASPVLYYTGDDSGEPHLGGIPARDLSGNDLARIAWAQRGEDRPSTPDDIPEKDLTTLRDALAETGAYRKTKPAEGTAPAAPAEGSDPA